MNVVCVDHILAEKKITSLRDKGGFEVDYKIERVKWSCHEELNKALMND